MHVDLVALAFDKQFWLRKWRILVYLKNKTSFKHENKLIKCHLFHLPPSSLLKSAESVSQCYLGANIKPKHLILFRRMGLLICLSRVPFLLISLGRIIPCWGRRLLGSRMTATNFDQFSLNLCIMHLLI